MPEYVLHYRHPVLTRGPLLLDLRTPDTGEPLVPYEDASESRQHSFEAGNHRSAFLEVSLFLRGIALKRPDGSYQRPTVEYLICGNERIMIPESEARRVTSDCL